MAKKISKRSKQKKDRMGKKAATKKRLKKTAAKRSSAKKPAAKRTAAPSKKLKRVTRPSTKKPKPKPQGKTVWKISPEKYGCTDEWVFKKDGVTIVLSQNYRFSFLIAVQKPNLTKYDPDKGIEIDKFKHVYFESGDNARGLDWTFPDDFPVEDQERIQSIWHKGYHDAMEEAGWHCVMDATNFYGDLSVEQVESEYPYNPA
jgi:hypothetical protein